MPSKKAQPKAQASPARQPDQATASGAAPKFESKGACGTSNTGCSAGTGTCGKVNDILLSGVYFAYLASAAFSVYTWCRDGLTIPKDFAALSDAVRSGCEHAKSNDLSVPLTLHKAWHAEVFTAKNDDVTLRTIFLLVNFVCALPLALFLLFGKNCGSLCQKPALIHATVMLVLAVHAVVENLAAPSSETLVFKCAVVIVLGAPLSLLHRWWKLDMSPSGCGICRVFCFFTHFIGFFGCVYCFIILGEWAAVKSGQEVTLVSPLIHQYTDEAFLHAKTHLGGVATAVTAKIEELTKQN